MIKFVDNEILGDVFIREFDQGIANKIGSVAIGGRSFVPSDKIPGVDVPLWDENHGEDDVIGTPMPGFPVIFQNPEDSVQRYNLPCFRISREDPSPALERWMSLHKKYRAPAPGANPVTVNVGGKDVQGYDQYQEQEGAWPYDIPYTITCEAAGIAARTHAQLLLKHAMKAFPPYATITVIDSDGESRIYNAFVEGPSDLSNVSEIGDRSIIYALSIRVSGEYDLADATSVKSVTSVATIRSHKGV